MKRSSSLTSNDHLYAGRAPFVQPQVDVLEQIGPLLLPLLGVADAELLAEAPRAVRVPEGDALVAGEGLRGGAAPVQRQRRHLVLAQHNQPLRRRRGNVSRHEQVAHTHVLRKDLPGLNNVKKLYVGNQLFKRDESLRSKVVHVLIKPV